MACVELGCVGLGCAWPYYGGLGWAKLIRDRMGWVGRGKVAPGLGWAGQCWVAWAGLCWVVVCWSLEFC